MFTVKPQNLLNGEVHSKSTIQQSICRMITIGAGFQCRVQFFGGELYNNAFQAHNLIHVTDTSNMKLLFFSVFRFSEHDLLAILDGFINCYFRRYLFFEFVV